MTIQKCPRCSSDRIRLGYRPTSILKKITFRYNLLCDACNWEFVGFALPGTVPSKSRKRKSSEDLESRVETANKPASSQPVKLEKNSKISESVALVEKVETEKRVASVKSASNEVVIAVPIKLVVDEEPVKIEAFSESGENGEVIETQAPLVKRVKVKKKKKVKIRL